jgi:hypothetical protein
VIGDDRRSAELLRLEREALEFLLGYACETLLFYAEPSNYNASDDGMEHAALDALGFIAGSGEAASGGPRR